jgi:hypothetical protein
MITYPWRFINSTEVERSSTITELRVFTHISDVYIPVLTLFDAKPNYSPKTDDPEMAR